MEFTPREAGSSAPTPVEEAMSADSEESNLEVDLEDYFGDPDGGDNQIDHGTPREPDPEPEEREEDPEPEEDGEVAEEEPAEEEPAEEKPSDEPLVTIKVKGEERQVTQEELIALAQKGEDYTQKTQALAEREKKVTGYEGLVGLVDTDPNFRKYLKDYGKPAPDQPAPAPVITVDSGQAPEDPVERVKWEAKQEVLKELTPVIDSLKQEVQTVKAGVAQVGPALKRDVDPFGQITHQALHNYIATLPEAAGRALYNEWDQSAEAYEEAYAWMREKVIEQHEALNASPGAEENPEAIAQEKEVKKAAKQKGKVEKKVKERAPILEQSGGAAVEASAADRGKQVKNLQNRIKNQEYDPHDVGALFDLIDPLD